MRPVLKVSPAALDWSEPCGCWQVDCAAVWLRLQQITGTTGASLEAEASSQPNTSSAMLVRFPPPSLSTILADRLRSSLRSSCYAECLLVIILSSLPLMQIWCAGGAAVAGGAVPGAGQPSVPAPAAVAQLDAASACGGLLHALLPGQAQVTLSA